MSTYVTKPSNPTATRSYQSPYALSPLFLRFFSSFSLSFSLRFSSAFCSFSILA
eukprot:m.81437 g.81437  ORF g.81437 m.81437 type:complete len:54 (+) comp14572_c0_seq1:695-856(+)